MKENEKERRIISVDIVRKVLLDMGLTHVKYLTNEEIGEASLLFDLGVEDHEIPVFLERVEKAKQVYLDKNAIIKFLHSGYAITVYELGEFSSTCFSPVKMLI